MTETTLAHFNGQNLTMSSRELASLTQTRHDSVKRTIETLSRKKAMTLPQIVEASFTDTLGKAQTVSEYQLNQRDTMVVAARLNPQFMARVVDRWMDLEQKQSTQHPANALIVKMWAQVDTLHTQITERDAQITKLLTDQAQTLLAQSYQINGLQGQLIASQNKQIGLMTSVQRLQQMREKREAKDAIIQMTREGKTNAAIVAATGRNNNHVRQVQWQARAAGVLPPLPEVLSPQANMFAEAA